MKTTNFFLLLAGINCFLFAVALMMPNKELLITAGLLFLDVKVYQLHKEGKFKW